jgi:hypothetical protein
MSSCRRLTISALTLSALFLLAPPARAQSSTTSADPFVVLTGRIDVVEGQVVSDAVIFDGPVNVAGTVKDNVFAFNGDVLVTGSVGGDVVALSGKVTVTSGAHVGGNVESQVSPEIAPGTVSGDIGRFSGFNSDQLGFRWLGRLIRWLVATGSSFLLGLALTLWMPRAADALAATSKRRMGGSFGWGLLWFFGIPIVGGLLAVTILAGLIGLGILLGLVLIYTVAYAIGAFLLGRRILSPPRGRFMAFLVGWGILRVAALVPVLGGIAWMLAVIWGLGAFMLTAFGAARAGGPTTDTVGLGSSGPSADLAVPPMPPMPS